jgi:glycosyltransferase involved in cell wall biosynthesis
MKSNLPKISVITPNYNQGAYLEKTILSVLEQEYPNLEYIIIDGGSTDQSISIIKKYESQLAYWVSEKDNGMYYAIEKGFQLATGTIMCWINSDDVLWRDSLKYVAEVFTTNTKVQWLQGYPSVIDEQGNLLYQREPVCDPIYFYEEHFLKTNAFIQQESTFWSRSLWNKCLGIDTTYKLAADFDLWMQFFEKETLYCTKKQLGAFRKREGQQSENIKEYLKEARASIAIHTKKLSLLQRIYNRLFCFNRQLTVKHWID